MSEEPESWLGGRLRLHQPARGAHRAGTDAVLLGALLPPGQGTCLYDLGAGTGAVGLGVAMRAPGARVVLVERAPELAGFARRNAALNGMAERVRVIEADLLATGTERRTAGLAPETADAVLTNPPFFEEGRYRASPVADKASAHAFPAGALDLWVRAGVDLLKPGGRLGLIHRADALPACLSALDRRFGAIAVRPVHARADRPALRVLITAVKGSRGPFGLLAPLVLQDEAGQFTPTLQRLNAGEGWIEAP